MRRETRSGLWEKHFASASLIAGMYGWMELTQNGVAGEHLVHIHIRNSILYWG